MKCAHHLRSCTRRESSTQVAGGDLAAVIQKAGQIVWAGGGLSTFRTVRNPVYTQASEELCSASLKPWLKPSSTVHEHKDLPAGLTFSGVFFRLLFIFPFETLQWHIPSCLASLQMAAEDEHQDPSVDRRCPF